MSDSPQTLNLLYLLDVMTRVIEDHKKRDEHGVDITEADLYFALPASEALNIYTPPEPPIPVGSLMADLDNMSALMNDEDRMAIPADLETIANVLRVAAGLLEQARR